MIFANHMDKLNQDIDEMEKLLDHEAKVKGIVNDMKSTNQKRVQSNTIRKYPCLVKLQQKKRRVIAAEKKTEGAYITSAVGQWIVFRFLSA